MDHLRNIRLVALKNVLVGPDFDAQWRTISRWYSRQFSTPLDRIDDLPRIDIWRHYYEDLYENLEDDKLHLELEELLKPQDELQKALDKSKGESDMDDLEKLVKAENAKAKKSPKDPKVAAKEMIKVTEDLGRALTDIKKSIEPLEGFNLDFDSLAGDGSNNL